MHVHLTVSASRMHFLEQSFPNLWSSSLPSGRVIKLKLVVIKKMFSALFRKFQGFYCY